MLKRSTYYKHGKRPRKSWVSTILMVGATILVGLGVYLLLLLRAPAIKPLNSSQQKAFTPEEIAEKRVIIPKIAVNADVFEGDQSVLDKGIWHRLPELGAPDTGGNFIVSAHRYVLATSPEKTKQQSYFYNIDKLELGDEILVDWHKKRYKYKITKIYNVKPTQLEIESPSEDAKITLYTCTLAGSSDGRVVIEAYPND